MKKGKKKKQKEKERMEPKKVRKGLKKMKEIFETSLVDVTKFSFFSLMHPTGRVCSCVRWYGCTSMFLCVLFSLLL